MEKKTWIEPELIVLVRSKPEEAVLSTCKMIIHTGPIDHYQPCVVLQDWCIECKDSGTS